ncbi:hypothetical protein [Aquimarina sp. 433]
MKELEKYKSKLIGKKLIKVLHSDQGEGIEHLNGLGNAYYFSTVLELENGEKYRFGNDWIDEWDESEKLMEVTHQNWEIKKNTKFHDLEISDLIIDEYHDVYIKLENEVLVYHKIDYGDKLFFDKYSKLFDSNGKLKSKNTIANKGNNSLWQRIKRIFNQ